MAGCLPAIPGVRVPALVIFLDDEMTEQPSRFRDDVSLLDFMAAHALTGLMAAPVGALCDDNGVIYGRPILDADIARMAYASAQAMLTERKRLMEENK
jgi:hypothetical protein